MTKIETKLPVDFVMRSVIMSLIFLGILIHAMLFDQEFFKNRSDYQPYMLVVALLISVSLFDLHLRNGYSLWYDDERVYWRKAGLARSGADIISIKFDDIRDVYSIGGGNSAIRLGAVGLSSGAAEASDILISTDYVRNPDLVSLLERVKAISGARFDQRVSEFMLAI